MPLFIVSTPIGNLSDITIRAVKILSTCSFVLSENTRTTANLLEHHGIIGKRIVNFTDHSEEKYFLPFLEAAKNQDICLVSEAGTPIIADPGYKIIKKAIEMDVKIFSVPGASSLTAAISVSGLPAFNFAFLGFYEKWKIKEIAKLLNLEILVALFVPARDILKTLTELETNFASHNISVARELTKFFEDVKTGTFADLKSHYSNHEKLKGEAVLMISGKLEEKNNFEIEAEIKKILAEKPFLKLIRPADLSEVLKCYEETLQNFSKKDIYNTLIKIGNS